MKSEWCRLCALQDEEDRFAEWWERMSAVAGQKAWIGVRDLRSEAVHWRMLGANASVILEQAFQYLDRVADDQFGFWMVTVQKDYNNNVTYRT